jgi:hypothetical protein
VGTGGKFFRPGEGSAELLLQKTTPEEKSSSRLLPGPAGKAIGFDHVGFKPDRPLTHFKHG